MVMVVWWFSQFAEVLCAVAERNSFLKIMGSETQLLNFCPATRCQVELASSCRWSVR